MRNGHLPALTIAAALALGAGAASAQTATNCDQTFEKLLSKLATDTLPSRDKWELMNQLHGAYGQCVEGDAEAWTRMVDSRLTRGVVEG